MILGTIPVPFTAGIRMKIMQEDITRAAKLISKNMISIG
jgi:endonuclease III-like uncharacterized protein